MRQTGVLSKNFRCKTLPCKLFNVSDFPQYIDSQRLTVCSQYWISA